MAMEARSVDAIPRGAEWQYEPKWDGFRCLLFARWRIVELRSKAGEDLTRYFPELVAAAAKLKAATFVLDGEIVVPHGKAFSFDDLLQRIHPAASRVAKLAQETPALFIAFDLLETAKDKQLSAQPLRERRPALEAFAKVNSAPTRPFICRRRRTSYATAKKWLAALRRRLRRRDREAARPALSVRQSRRHAEDQEIPQRRLRDRRLPLRDPQADGRKVVGSLLLGLYDDERAAAPCRLHLRDQRETSRR